MHHFIRLNTPEHWATHAVQHLESVYCYPKTSLWWSSCELPPVLKTLLYRKLNRQNILRVFTRRESPYRGHHLEENDEGTDVLWRGRSSFCVFLRHLQYSRPGEFYQLASSDRHKARDRDFSSFLQSSQLCGEHLSEVLTNTCCIVFQYRSKTL